MPREVKDINVEIGARVKHERIEQKLTREELAKLSGYSANFIQEVERGRSGLSSESLRSLSLALHVSSDALLFGKPSNDFEHIIRKLCTVPPAKLHHIIKIIEEAVECTRLT